VPAPARAAELGFAISPPYLNGSQFVLSFDDGPDAEGNTETVLDILEQQGVKATFFVNTEKHNLDVATSLEAQATIRRMFEDGHEVGTHTVTHRSLPTLSSADVRQEIYSVQNTLRSFLGDGVRLSLFRAPYGEFYLYDFHGWALPTEITDYSTEPPTDRPILTPQSQVESIAAEETVHVGWNLDTFDWVPCQSADPGHAEMVAPGESATTCVFDRIRHQIETQDRRGIILLHSIQPRTVDSLALIIEYIKNNGYEFSSTEQAVCNALGRTSAHFIDGQDGCDFTPPVLNPDLGAGGAGNAGATGNPAMGGAGGTSIGGSTASSGGDGSLGAAIGGMASAAPGGQGTTTPPVGVTEGTGVPTTGGGNGNTSGGGCALGAVSGGASLLLALGAALASLFARRRQGRTQNR
jgi:peptidoglycan/xylan/chitin deacetylase (PgdA/CDA1 family)